MQPLRWLPAKLWAMLLVLLSLLVLLLLVVLFLLRLIVIITLVLCVISNGNVCLYVTPSIALNVDIPVFILILCNSQRLVHFDHSNTFHCHNITISLIKLFSIGKRLYFNVTIDRTVFDIVELFKYYHKLLFIDINTTICSTQLVKHEQLIHHTYHWPFVYTTNFWLFGSGLQLNNV